jgi:spastin
MQLKYFFFCTQGNSTKHSTEAFRIKQQISSRKELGSFVWRFVIGLRKMLTNQKLHAVEDRLQKLTAETAPSTIWGNLYSAFSKLTDKALGIPQAAPPAQPAKSNLQPDDFTPAARPQPRLSASTTSVIRNTFASSSKTGATPQPAAQPAKQLSQSAPMSSSEDDLRAKALLQSLKGIDTRLKEIILNEVVEEKADSIEWDSVVGLGEAKRTLEEAVILPLVRSDLFKGLRRPAKGVLLYGPPGNGKTLIAKALALRSKARFFNMSASSLTSKWVGEGEKLVKALFLIARYVQPSVIFIDEVDSLLSARRSDENDAARRLKTEFLVQMDGVGTSDDDKVLVLAATNRPFDLDDAVLRRFARRILVPLPDASARGEMIEQLLRHESTRLSSNDLDRVVKTTEGYSFSDLKSLCGEAAMGPLRDYRPDQLAHVDAQKIRPIQLRDLLDALKRVTASTSPETMHQLRSWVGAK